MDIYYTQKVNQAFQDMHEAAEKYRHEFTTPEHFIYALLRQYEFNKSLIDCGVDLNIVNKSLQDYFEKMERVPEDVGNYVIGTSEQLRAALLSAYQTVQNSSAQYIYVPHIVRGILNLKESYAAYLLRNLLGDWESEFLSMLVGRYEADHDQVSDGSDAEEEQDKEPWRKMVTCLNDT